MNSVDRFPVLVLDPTVISRVLLGLLERYWLSVNRAELPAQRIERPRQRRVLRFPTFYPLRFLQSLKTSIDRGAIQLGR